MANAQNDVEECSSPTLDWMPFTPPPTAAKPAPTVKTGPESRRHRAAAAALARNQLVEGCKTPAEFVCKVVYGAIPGMFHRWVDQSPAHDAPQTEWAEFVRARRAMSDTSIAWWMKEVFGGALPIALALVGAQHTGNCDMHQEGGFRMDAGVGCDRGCHAGWNGHETCWCEAGGRPGSRGR
jgi:hypothetical protein